MEPLLYILAFAGVSALLLRLARAAFVLLQRAGQAWLAGEAAKRRHEHGDLTGLSEAADQERRARNGRRFAALALVCWLALLLLPPFTDRALEIYAACSVLWLVRTRVRSATVVDVQRMRR